MSDREQFSTGSDRIRYSGKLWSSSPIAQEPILLLAELAVELSRAKDFQRLQQVLSRQLRWILDFDRCTLAVQVEYSHAEYFLFEITSPSKEKETPPLKISIAEGWTGRVLVNSKPYFIEDLTQLPAIMTPPPKADLGIAPQARSLMLLPLRMGEDTIGCINFSSHTVGAYSPLAWQNLASLLASVVGGHLGSVLTQMQLKSAFEFREKVMEGVTDAIYTLDLAGNFTLFNARTAELTGYSVEELPNFSFLKLFYPNEATRIQALLSKTITCGASINHYEAEMVRKDGSRRVVSFNLAPLLQDGKISAVVSTAQDVTARRQAEAALLRAKVVEAANSTLERQVQERTFQLQQALDFEARLKRIADKVRDSLDESQIVQAAVQELALGLGVGSCNMALYDLEQGTSTVSYEYATSIPASQGRIARMANFPEIYRQLLQNQYFQFCSLVSNPIRGQVAMLAYPVADDQGVIGDLWLINQKNHVFSELEIRLVQQVANQCAIAIRQARLYQAATAQVRELEKLNQIKDEFLSTVSHELRTPITNIKMAIQMLRIASTDAARERYLEILRAECEREAQLINDLLDLQRLEATSYQVSLEVVNLLDWLPGIVEPFRSRAQERQQNLQVYLPPVLPPLTTHLAGVERIVVELLNNACKYTPAGGEISFSVSYMGKRYKQGFIPLPKFELSASAVTIFTVRNQVEIPATELPHIFDKFYRVPNSDPWKQGGTGLGLALVQKLVEQLEGVIQVESKEGWTIFTVCFPNKQSVS